VTGETKNAERKRGKGEDLETFPCRLRPVEAERIKSLELSERLPSFAATRKRSRHLDRKGGTERKRTRIRRKGGLSYDLQPK